MIVLDTSALVAVLSGEPERASFNATIAAEVCCLSAATHLEASIVIASRYGPAGRHDLSLYLHEAAVEVVAVDRDQADVALRAWTTYGKGRHPAALNFGDLFSYALAKVRGAPLLFKGDDFARTDVPAA